MTEGCEYRKICEAYKIYSSHPELSLYVWFTDNCDKGKMGICVSKEKFKEESKLENKLNLPKKQAL